MKKALSFILALTLIVSLVPSVVFAEDTATDIVAEFSKNYITYANVNGSGQTLSNNSKYILDETQISATPTYTTDSTTGEQSLNTSGVLEFNGDFALLYDQMYSKIKTVQHRAYRFTPSGSSSYVYAVRFNTLRTDKTMTSWIADASNNGGKLAFSMPLTQAGWYDVKIHAAKIYFGSSYYVYVNGQYAGIYDCNGTDATFTDSNEETLNKLYLEPTENNTAEVVFCLAEEKYATGTDAWLMMYKFTLSPTTDETAEFEKFVTTGIPETMTVGDTAEVTVSAYTTDGELHRANGRNLADAAENDDLKIEAVYGDSITVTQESRDLCEGVATATFTANKVGETEITYSTVINGKTYTETKRIWVLDENGSQPTIDVKMTCAEIVYSEVRSKADSIDTWVTHGFDIVYDKTTTSASHRNQGTKVGTEKVPQIAPHAGSWVVWPNQESSKNRNLMFTISKNVPVAGYYTVNFQAALWFATSQIAIYVNGEYAGDYNTYDSTVTTKSLTLGENKKLNTIKLPAGDVEISFRSRKAYYGSLYFIPYKLTLTPATEDGATLASVTTSMGEAVELSNGATLTGTAQAMMKDGSVRSFGYTDAGAVPSITNATDDVISVSSSNKNVVSVEAVCVEADIFKDTTQTIDPTTTEFTLTANNPGTAVITVTAQVNGETKTATSTVTVPYTDGSEAAQKEIAYIVRGSESKFNAGINMTGYIAGEVGSHPLNTSFTAVANEEITVDNIKYNFAYWQTAGGTPIEDAGASYPFTPKSNFTLEAVYVPAEPTDADKKVQFWNYNRAFIGEQGVQDDGTVETIPDEPTLAGHTFTGWAAENIGAFGADTQLTAALTRVVAQFTADADKYSVKIDGTEKGKYAYGELFEETAAATKDEQVFSHWAVGDTIVSYDAEIKFYVWNNIELTAVYADAAPEAVPTVMLDNIGDEYFIAYRMPTGYTPIDAGIVFGSSDPRVDSTDGSKASVREVKAKGQFTAQPNTEAAYAVARGYIIYKVDATGDIRVLYTK